MFVGSLYGITPGRDGSSAPSKIKDLQGIYHSTIKQAWRIAKDFSTGDLLAWTGMPTWKTVCAKALRIQLSHLKSPKVLSKDLYNKQERGKMRNAISYARTMCISRLQEKIFKKNKTITWRRNKHPITKEENHYLENERCPLCHQPDQNNHLLK